MSLYVYCNIFTENSSIDEVYQIDNKNILINEYPTCSPNEEYKHILDKKERLIMKHQKELLDKACSSDLGQFMKDSTKSVYEKKPLILLAHDITNMAFFNDYNKMGCFDYEKTTFIKDLYNHRVKELVTANSIGYQILYYSLKYINMIAYLPLMVTSIFSINIIDLFFY